MYPMTLYIRHRPILIMIGSSLLINLLIWLWLFFSIRPGVESVFLHYSALYGVNLIGEWHQIFFVPAFGLVVLVINSLVGWVLFQKDRFIAHLLSGIVLLVHLFLVIVSFLLVFLNV